jgi:hypothetical protein
MKKGSKILLALAACLALNAYNGCRGQNARNSRIQQAESGNYEFDSIDMIVVNKIPRGVFAGEEMPEGNNFGWHDIGLSRNGEKPIEYIWRPNVEYLEYSHHIIEIGDRITIYLSEWARQNKMRLPQPNAKEPPITGSFGEAYWEKRE